ncbi:hydrolase or metal-binding protein [Polaromonas sp.]|uniref:recombination directionality factor n=1 Tax=Polaromonas sp. TaxID=1869339 RepID=UPI00182A43BC|nr:hydrolase or metal-binding protein [Polaromonas sp.]NML87424.1 hydrolase or metal-binding protein [Polaromonas sp.]
MLKGLALTPPVIGRIAIGKVVEKSGKLLPEKDDEFTVTSQVQNKDGWVNHPVDESLRKTPGSKLRNIPVRLLFDDPDLNLRANYSMFDRRTGRPLCVGNGETCRRCTAAGIQTLPCPAPEACDLAGAGYCKPYGRLNVRIGDDDELGSFVFRTTGFNSIRTLSTRLRYFHAVSGGLLSTLPLELRLRGKSTTQSHRAAIYYVDLTVRTGMTMTEALASAMWDSEARKTSGFDQAALDGAARQGFADGAFEESEEEGAAVVEEFYPDEFDNGSPGKTASTGTKPGLADKLNQKAAQFNGSAASVPVTLAARSEDRD